MIAEARLFGAKGGELLSRSLARDPDLAVLVVSASPNLAEAVRYLQYGAMDYLPKPLDLPAVEAALQRALRRRRELMQERGAGTFAQGRDGGPGGASWPASAPRSRG